jgi:hypothetical protein
VKAVWRSPSFINTSRTGAGPNGDRRIRRRRARRCRSITRVRLQAPQPGNHPAATAPRSGRSPRPRSKLSLARNGSVESMEIFSAIRRESRRDVRSPGSGSDIDSTIRPVGLVGPRA